MIAFVTGLPGAGKTSWLVEHVITPLLKVGFKENAIDHDGNKVVVTRRIFTNINGLMVPHELIGPDELNTWHEWVKPGDIILYDEVQKPWPKVPAGTKKPMCISELETHRHYGVDFWLLTQNTNLVNDAPVTLAGMQKHVRKVGNTRYATVYEWDGVSKTLNYKAALTKKPWRRSKDTEKMYRSSALHTKQQRALPTALWVFLLMVLAIPFAFKYVTARMDERFDPVHAAASAASQPMPKAAPSSSQDLQTHTQVMASTASMVEPAKPKLIGCVAKADRCECYDQAGTWIETEVQQCRQSAGRGGVLVPYELHSPFIASIKSMPHPEDRDEVAPVMVAIRGELRR